MYWRHRSVHASVNSGNGAEEVVAEVAEDGAGAAFEAEACRSDVDVTEDAVEKPEDNDDNESSGSPAASEDG